MVSTRFALALTVTLSCALSAHAAVLLHGYDFGSGVTDSVGGQDGTLVGAAALGDHALATDGASGYVQFASHLVPTSGSMSVAFWARQDSRSGWVTEFISQGFTGGPGFYLGHDERDHIRITDQAASTGIATGAVGSWVHYAMTVDADTPGTRLYMDGTAVFEVASAFQSGAGGTDTRLARQFGDYGEFFHGAMDDLMIYSGSLSAAEVLAMYQAGRSTGPVPEPGAGALLVPGLFVMGWVVRRRGWGSTAA
jgi:hypothetical protein